MSQLTRINSCLNCFHEQVKHLKASSETCKECFAKDLPSCRYPNWKEIKEK